MPYCFVKSTDGATSFEKILGTKITAQLSGDGSGVTIAESVLAEVIADAQSIVDGHVGVRYTVPFEDGSVPKEISQCTLDIAIFKAYENKSGADSRVRQRYEDAMALLDKIAKGRFALALTTGDVVAATAAPSVRVKGKPRLFDRDDE